MLVFQVIQYWYMYFISTLLIICNNVTVRNSWPCVTDIPEVKTMYSGSGMIICLLMNINELFVQYPIGAQPMNITQIWYIKLRPPTPP